jgi:predicted enzyme related to lactoylglutathione lyase
MTDSEFPAPREGFVLTHFLVVADQDRSRDFYREVFGAKVVNERDPDGHLIEVGQTTARPDAP